MHTGVATHTNEFGPSDATKRGSTVRFEHDATQLLLHQLSEVGRCFRAFEHRIWGFGFNPIDIPMLFVFGDVDSNASFGICSGPVDLERLGRVDGGVVGEILTAKSPPRQRVDGASDDDPRFLWVNQLITQEFRPSEGQEVGIDPNLGGAEALVFDLSDCNYQPQSWEFARFVVHEAFHHHQLFDAKWRVPVGYDPATPPCSDREHHQIAREEVRLLELAALAQDDRHALAFLGRFLLLRDARHRRWPATEMLERGTEQVEGSARYVENQYSSCSGRAGRLNMPREALRTDGEWVDFGRLYRTGARMLEILDRFDIPWRERLTCGEDPCEIVRQTMF
jgi:hypothetical protein